VRGYTQLAQQSSWNVGVNFFLGNSGAGILGGAQLNSQNAAGANAPANTGAGGGGASNGASQAAHAGGNGGTGLLIVKEYLSF
jgi:hypothetical protein